MAKTQSYTVIQYFVITVTKTGNIMRKRALTRCLLCCYQDSFTSVSYLTTLNQNINNRTRNSLCDVKK